MFHIPHNCPGQAVERDSASLAAACRYPISMAAMLAVRVGLKSAPDRRRKAPARPPVRPERNR